MSVVDIGSRLELFTDRHLVETLAGLAFKLHEPQLAPPPHSPVQGHYMTVIRDGGAYRAYYRQYDPTYTGEKYDGSPGEVTCYSESRDGTEWSHPDLGLCEVAGSRRNNAVLRLAPFSHNFAPFLDANPRAQPGARFKALAGTHASSKHQTGDGLHAFGSADGTRWAAIQDGPVFNAAGFAFDSQNVSFWSEAEGCYVCYYRTWETSHGRLRTISRTTSEDFLHWTTPVAMDPNLEGEHLYTSQAHPYFRAPHLVVALPTRFQPDRGSSTDILFMTSRAGSARFDRLFTEAFIRPGLDPARWGNRSNYAACGVVPTGPAEMSIYHGPAGRRYTLRTDGFVSIHAGAEAGELTTRPFLFSGAGLVLNVATSAAGVMHVEVQDGHGHALPGRALADADAIYGDAVERTASWRGSSDVSALAGTPVRLRVVMKEADLYSMAFRPAG